MHPYAIEEIPLRSSEKNRIFFIKIALRFRPYSSACPQLPVATAPVAAVHTSKATTTETGIFILRIIVCPDRADSHHCCNIAIALIDGRQICSLAMQQQRVQPGSPALPGGA